MQKNEIFTGKVIDYTVKEDVPEGYTSNVEGTKITNTHSPELINIPVEKKWVDDNLSLIHISEPTRPY